MATAMLLTFMLSPYSRCDSARQILISAFYATISNEGPWHDNSCKHYQRHNDERIRRKSFINAFGATNFICAFGATIFTCAFGVEIFICSFWHDNLYMHLWREKFWHAPLARQLLYAPLTRKIFICVFGATTFISAFGVSISKRHWCGYF